MSSFDDMLNLDPLLEAEKLTGKSYKEDEDTMRLGFGLHIAHAQRKEAELSLRDDTHFNSDWADTLRIFADLGFEVVHEHQFPATYSDTIETFLVLWRPDGILATAESYGERRNNANLYYNWRPNADVESVWQYTSSGHFHTESYDRGDKVWVGHHDVREAMRHTIAQLESNGKFIAPWIERPFLWLLDYSQPKVEGYDYEAISAKVIATLPDHVRKVITP